MPGGYCTFEMLAADQYHYANAEIFCHTPASLLATLSTDPSSFQRKKEKVIQTPKIQS
jgi:hypothetical protein